MEGYWDKQYPTHIEVPEGYWTITTTVSVDFEEDKNKYWHNAEDN